MTDGVTNGSPPPHMQLTCPACKTGRLYLRPDPPTIVQNMPPVSMLVVVHEKPERCGQCGAIWTLAMAAEQTEDGILVKMTVMRLQEAQNDSPIVVARDLPPGLKAVR